MLITRLHARFGRVFTQRCFYLFASMVALIVVAPFIGAMERGWVVINVAQVLVLIAAVAAVGRTMMPFVIALLLGIPAFGFLVMARVVPEDAVQHFAWATTFFIAFYAVAVVYLLQYVFNPQVMTTDKLFGAAAVYMMLGILWAYAYQLVQFFEPQAFGMRPDGTPRTFYDLLYMSFGCLTSNGLGDINPVGARARSLVIVEAVTGTLFVAILIARLAGIYPPKDHGDGPPGS